MAFKLFDNVMESSTTTGTGAFTLAGAITGFSTFASRYSTGDTCYYAIKEVDAAGGPFGAWEVGIGTYSAANTLTRTTVLSSSNSDALVNFAAGTKRVFVTLTALQGNSIREKLTEARTYYVRTDGSDSNNGLANTSGGAFLTIQKAINVICTTLDTSIYTVYVQVNDGTFSEAVTLKSHIGDFPYVIQGNSSSPTNVHINVSGVCFTTSDNKVNAKIKNMKLTSTSVSVYVPCGQVEIAEGIVFAAATSGHISTQYNGYINCTGNYSITGGSGYHMRASGASKIRNPNKTITLTGTPAFSTAFAVADGVSYIICTGNTYSGSATGSRYTSTMNSVIDSSGVTLPGNSAGTTATGGQYI